MMASIAPDASVISEAFLAQIIFDVCPDDRVYDGEHPCAPICVEKRILCE
jgi:hypothetical protein